VKSTAKRKSAKSTAKRKKSKQRGKARQRGRSRPKRENGGRVREYVCRKEKREGKQTVGEGEEKVSKRSAKDKRK
jgi:hypothetical protein